MVAFRRAALKGKRGGIRAPAGTPIQDFVIWKVMPGWLASDSDWPHAWVIPEERPIIFSIQLPEPFEPIGDALSLTIAVALCKAVQDVVIGVKSAARMRARILITFAGSGEWSFENITEVKYIVA